MCRLFETIKISEKKLCNLNYHNLRFNKGCKEIFGIDEYCDLAEVIDIPDDLDFETHKCRVVYDSTIRLVSFEPYIRREIKSIKIVQRNEVNYSHKYLDRTLFDKMLKDEKSCDEILIVKNGFITDTSFSNVAFFNGLVWYTPENPLLKGTMRAFLLDTKKIEIAKIRVEDLYKFEKISLINAMNSLGDIELPISCIVF